LLGDSRDIELRELIAHDAKEIIRSERAMWRRYSSRAGAAEVFVELVRPPIQLIVCGAGQDAVPVVSFAKQLGWSVLVLDPRSAYAAPERFPLADLTLSCAPDRLASEFSPRGRVAAIVMTHKFEWDRDYLRSLALSNLDYVGILGPKKRSIQVLEAIEAEGFSISSEQRARMRAPVGLDIGAETPEEIALSVLAEIQSVFAGHAGGFLRDRQGPIHHPNDDAHAASANETVSMELRSCPLLV